MKFVRCNNLNETSNASLIDGRGRAWAVQLLKNRHPDLRVRITKGWYAFYKYNEIKEGDVCVFYLIKKRSTAIIFDVKICRTSHVRP